jgi:hypothetical protein
MMEKMLLRVLSAALRCQHRHLRLLLHPQQPHRKAALQMLPRVRVAALAAVGRLANSAIAL